MPDFLHQFFGLICGQNLGHTWSPGGEPLPCCQRCTGVYVGAISAALVHLVCPPKPNNSWLWLNGAFLMLMIPFGYHWFPQDPKLRAGSGILFGFALVAYLWLPFYKKLLPAAELKNSRLQMLVCFFALLSALVGVSENLLAAVTLEVMVTVGALAITLLLLANLLLAVRGLWRCFFQRASPATA